jgi:hypothetical protein
MLKKFIRDVGVGTLSIALGFLLIAGVAITSAQEWQEPAESPPAGGVEPPVNIGPEFQLKQGYLGAPDFWLDSWVWPDGSFGALSGELFAIENEEWKLIAQGGDFTEEARITLDATGARVVTDGQYSGQRASIGTFNWPVFSEKAVGKIAFKVLNPSDYFCMNANGTLSLASGIGGQGSCEQVTYRGGGASRQNVSSPNWIDIAINGVKQTICHDAYGRNLRGLHARPNVAVVCEYPFAGSLDSIVIEEADWSASYGQWNWEVWYSASTWLPGTGAPRPSPVPDGGGGGERPPQRPLPR